MEPYGADSIQILEGLDPVRRRPGMYLGGVDRAAAERMLWLVIDNAIDEHLAGHASALSVTVESGVVTVEDNGRGLPLDAPRQGGKPAVELIFSTLFGGCRPDHAGRTLSGVGVAVVNALSSRCDVEVHRAGGRHHIAFEGGRLVEGLRRLEASHRTGTRVRFVPDARIFTGTDFDLGELERRLRALSFLCPTLTITHQGAVMRGPSGLAGFVQRELGAGPADGVFTAEGPSGDAMSSAALAWRHAGQDPRVFGYVRYFHTREGAHVEGLRAGLRRAARLARPDLGKVHDAALDEVLGRGLVAVLHVEVADPVFQNTTRDRLLDPEVALAVEVVVGDALAETFSQCPQLLRGLLCRARVPG